jgi:phytoene desaturase
MMTRDNGISVAIVGAGPGGLAAAAMLAAAGLRVRVFESQPTLGGRTSRIRLEANSGTYCFDRGPTFFLMPYVLEEVFAAAGRRLHDYADLRRLDPMYRLLIGRPGREPARVDATQDIDEMTRRLSALNPSDAANFRRFINDNRYKLKHSESILRNPMRSPMDLFGSQTWADTLKVGPVLRPDLSVHQMLGKYFADPVVKLSVSFQSKYLGMSPYDCPSLFTILPFIEYEYGVWHPIGGCNALMHALAEVAREHGAEISCGTPVEAVEFVGSRASAVIARGERLEFDHIVINADTAHALKTLIPEPLRARGGHTDAALDSKRYSCSTYMLYLGVKGEAVSESGTLKGEPLAHHTIYVSEKYKENLDDISHDGTMSEDPSFYVCNPSRTDKTLAPAGDSALYVLVPTPSEKISAGKLDWSRDAAALREVTLDQMERKLGLTNLRGRIVAEQACTPSEWRGMGINFGATFNLAHNLGQMLHKRPQNKLPYTDNVYLVGGGTHPGSGLPTIFLSAQISSRLLCEAAGITFPAHSARNTTAPRPMPVSV